MYSPLKNYYSLVFGNSLEILSKLSFISAAHMVVVVVLLLFHGSTDRYQSCN